jgi:putative redox protein
MATMQSKVRWISKLIYQGDSRTHKVILDAKKDSGGLDSGMTPKELVLTGLCGCSGMDVISLLTSKYKLPITQCEVHAEATSSEGGHPVVWTKISLHFVISGEATADQVVKAVELSMTKYCGVSAMLSRACPIEYAISLNAQSVGSGQAKF